MSQSVTRTFCLMIRLGHFTTSYHCPLYFCVHVPSSMRNSELLWHITTYFMFPGSSSLPLSKLLKLSLLGAKKPKQEVDVLFFRFVMSPICLFCPGAAAFETN